MDAPHSTDAGSGTSPASHAQERRERRAPVTDAMGGCGQAEPERRAAGEATAQVDLKLRVEELDVTMVPGVAGAGEGPSSRLPRGEPKEDREERILALLGIVGTVLNLLVVIFVYIYTTI
ncbi:hypothetical protein lerEdw1_009627 [Lerista edwardsae]|nr:hypothetical protein lerEdw1_009627 [Lerista edwardsae]